MPVLNYKPGLYPGLTPCDVFKKPEPEVPEKPFSGRYEGSAKKDKFEIKVDMDEIREFSEVLHRITGTVYNDDPALTGTDYKAVYFSNIVGNPIDVKTSPKKRVVNLSVKCVGTNGKKYAGQFEATFKQETDWWIDFTLTYGPPGERKTFTFKKGQKKSPFFKDVKIDIDHAIKDVVWPEISLGDSFKNKPKGMENRKIDARVVFEDAGIQLHYKKEDSQKVEDPTPETAWSKADLFHVMQENFQTKDKATNIWCLQADEPTEKESLGVSFDKNGMKGFVLYMGHPSLKAYKSDYDKVRKDRALRKILHYIIHECGKCLGLKQAFELGHPFALTWMNYSWLYDEQKGAGKFYESFGYSFTNDELFVLRHSPHRTFSDLVPPEVLTLAMGEKYAPKQEIMDDDEQEETEKGYGSSGGYGSGGGYSGGNGYSAVSGGGYSTSTGYSSGYGGGYSSGGYGSGGYKGGYGKKPKLDYKPKKKIGLGLGFKTTTVVLGGMLSVEAKVKNYGKLPVVVEGNLKPEYGNLQLYITGPDGKGQNITPYVKPIKSGYGKPTILYSSDYKEGPDRYSDLITIGDSDRGHIFQKVGKYTVKAKYSSGVYSTTSQTYTVNAVPPPPFLPAATGYKVAEAAALGGSSYKGYEPVKQYYNDVVKSEVETQKGHVAAMIELLEGLTKPPAKEYGGYGKKSTPKEKPAAYLQPEEVLKDTYALVDEYHQNGKKEDNIYYSKLVMKRAKMYIKNNDYKGADNEVSQMLSDLVKRDVKYEVIKEISNEYEGYKAPTAVTDTYSPSYLQDKVSKVVNWTPTYETKEEDDDEDDVGFGLNWLFNDFEPEHIEKANKVTEKLNEKYEETQDLNAVMEYADILQKGRAVNYKVVQYAVKAYVATSHDSHEAGMKFPEPPKTDPADTKPAFNYIKRKGSEPEEDWMRYWRCDADFNFHHEHWHSTYTAGRTQFRPHLARQGELFAYMHSQMLARYDAERESWKMKPVKQLEYGEILDACDVGEEFHNAPQYKWLRPRRAGKIPESEEKLLMEAEQNYLDALSQASKMEWKLKNRPNDYYVLDPNWAGYATEPTTGKYGRTMNIGSLHNRGHGVLGKMTEPGFSSYMGGTNTAVRDFIFFRWHKRIDNLIQKCNDKWYNDLSSDAPKISITESDVIITNSEAPPKDFGAFSGNDWKIKKITKSTLETYLAPPEKAFEWDDKLTHKKFSYHIRFKRNDASEAIKLTFRVFICPEKVCNNRRRWIEMDKFVVSMDKNQKHSVFTRADYQSSVIRRAGTLGDTGPDQTEKKAGFCDCGWPYSMLLPRGTPSGENYKLMVFVSDNNIDNINKQTKCGSMSYCGAKDSEYPDSRPMGYPLSTKTVINNKFVENIPEEFSALSNAAVVDFKIKNAEWDEDYSDVVETSEDDTKIVWPVNQETMPTEGYYTPFNYKFGPYIRNIIFDEDAVAGGKGHEFIRIRFKGRGKNYGEYGLSNAFFADMDSETRIKTKIPLTVNGATRFSVPETGCWSDYIQYKFDPAEGDYAVEFKIESPGCVLKLSGRKNSYRSANPDALTESDWKKLPFFVKSRFLYCIEKIQSSKSQQ